MDVTEHYDNDKFVNWAIIAAIEPGSIDDRMRATPRELTMSLNGIELNPIKFIKRLEEQFNMIVDKEADKRFKTEKLEILSKYQDKVEELNEIIEHRLIADLTREFGEKDGATTA